MTPADLSAFEAGRVAPSAFGHAEHLEAAFMLLRQAPFLEAVCRYVCGIRALAKRAGHPDKFNMTITFAYLSVIAERMADAPEANWPDFIGANADLYDRSLLHRWYGPARLSNPKACGSFLMPGGGK